MTSCATEPFTKAVIHIFPAVVYKLERLDLRPNLILWAASILWLLVNTSPFTILLYLTC